MDRLFRARFYQIENVKAGEATFYDCLQQLWSRVDCQVYQDVGNGVNLRLERHEEHPVIPESDFVAGEFVRQQYDNLPPVAETRMPLRENTLPLGHRAAFRYHPETERLLLESRQGAVSTAHINKLIRRRIRGHHGFYFAPVLSSDAYRRLQEGTPRRVEVRVARPAEMHSVENSSLTIEENLERLANVFEGPVVEFSVGWPRGNRDGILSRRSLRALLPWLDNNRGNVEKLRVKLAEDDTPLDLLAERLKVEALLDLPSDDVEANYRSRASCLVTGFDRPTND